MEEQKRSQRFYCFFNILNGLSYGCLGGTVIILFAIQLNCTNPEISILNGMFYFGYLLLPLGKIVSARAGAVRCQVYFWFIRNFSVLLVGFAAPVYLFLSQRLAFFILLIGAFLFYGARAAGIVVIQPLFGEITSRNDRADFFGRSLKYFYASYLLVILAITGLLHITGNNIWPLTGIIVFGAIVGIISTRMLWQIDESGAIQKFAQKPAGSELRKLLRSTIFCRMLIAGTVINLSILLLIPFCTVAIKRGYCSSDGTALVYYVIFLTSLMMFSKVGAYWIRRVGPRNIMLLMELLLIITGMLWLLAPEKNNFWYPGIIMLLCGGTQITLMNAMNIYFLEMIPQSSRVFASILVAVISGAGAGILGMILSGSLLKILGGMDFYRNLWTGPLGLYQVYFAAATVLLLPGIYSIYRMIPIPIEKRTSRRNIFWAWLYPHQAECHDD